MKVGEFEYPSTDVVEAMTLEEADAHLVVASQLLEKLKLQICRLGGKGLWILSFRSKIDAIKAVREITGLGLKEAKQILDQVEMGTPQLLSGGFSPSHLGIKLLERHATVEWRT